MAKQELRGVCLATIAERGRWRWFGDGRRGRGIVRSRCAAEAHRSDLASGFTTGKSMAVRREPFATRTIAEPILLGKRRATDR